MSMIYKILKKAIPASLKQLIKPIFFFIKYRFVPPPAWSDLSGYEVLLDALLKEKIVKVEGDFVEIGVFLGGGTYKLSKFLEKNAVHKKLYAIDIFSPDFDKSVCTQGMGMNELYKSILKDKDQMAVYKDITKNCSNIITIKEDSMIVELPCKKVAFAYIDGNHDPKYVKNDFYLVWDKISPGGVVSFDDYGHDLPGVTKAIDELVAEKAAEISKTWTVGLKTIFIRKK